MTGAEAPAGRRPGRQGLALATLVAAGAAVVVALWLDPPVAETVTGGIEIRGMSPTAVVPAEQFAAVELPVGARQDARGEDERPQTPPAAALKTPGAADDEPLLNPDDETSLDQPGGVFSDIGDALDPDDSRPASAGAASDVGECLDPEDLVDS